jgi:hypothetical protein
MSRFANDLAHNVRQVMDSLPIQASRSVAPAILDHAGVCMETPANAGGLKPLLAYTDEVRIGDLEVDTLRVRRLDVTEKQLP